MQEPAGKSRGFTLVELMVVLALMAAVAAVATYRMTRARPRASLVGATVELRSFLHQARQQALVSGVDVAVLVFPAASGQAGSAGRVVIYQDGAFDFFNATSAVHFGAYNPLVLAAGPRGQVVGSFDLPPGVTFGPAAGLGTSATLPAPLTTIPVNQECTFCAGAGAARRGAVVFDPRGRARFYNGDGLPLAVDGGALSLTAASLEGTVPLVRLLAITATTGSLKSVNLD